MTTTKTTQPASDPLGYDGIVIEHLRRLAEDKLAAINSDPVA
jgi:hypothetical protein